MKNFFLSVSSGMIAVVIALTSSIPSLAASENNCEPETENTISSVQVSGENSNSKNTSDGKKTDDDSENTSSELSYPTEGVIPDMDYNPEDDGFKVIKNAEDYYDYTFDPDNVKPMGNSSLPSSVDNSTSKYFPEIGYQRGGSCMFHAAVYNQFTYTYNKAHNIKTDYNTIFSPKFLYNLNNQGTTGGTVVRDGYNLMKNIGCVTMRVAPFGHDYTPNEEQYCREICTDEYAYRFAANHRIEDFYFFEQPGTGNRQVTSPDDSDLSAMKAALANGEILTFYRIIGYTTKLKASDNPDVNKGVAGETCVYCSTSGDGAHEMAIVGYNDNIWTDVNNNGQIDSGEMGAFKIANSYGPNQDNKGFLWVAYDALNEKTSVNGGPQPEKRIALFWEIVGIKLMPDEYDPHVFLKWTLNTNDRFNSYVKLTGTYGSEQFTETVDPITYRSDTLVRAYDGYEEATDASFVYNMDQILSKFSTDDYTKINWTLSFEHTKDNGSSLIIKDCYLYDEKTGRMYKPQNAYPITVTTGSRSVTLPTDYNNFAIVYYKGYNDPLISYSLGNVNSGFTTEAMTSNNDKDSYYYKHLINLGKNDAAYAYFSNTSGKVDKNGTVYYKVQKGFNYFTTSYAAEKLTLSLRKNLGNISDTDTSLKMYCQAKGGYGPYTYKYTIKDLNTNEVVFSNNYIHPHFDEREITAKELEYATNINSTFKFTKESKYYVVIDAKDVTGATTSYSFNIEIKDLPFRIAQFTIENPADKYECGKELTLRYITENDSFSPAHFFSNLRIFKDGKQVYKKLIYPTNSSDSTTKSMDIPIKWTPTIGGNYTAFINRTDNDGAYVCESIKFSVTNNSVSASEININPGNNLYIGETAKLNVTASNGVGPYQYKYSYIRYGEEKEISAYNENSSCDFAVPNEPGAYTLRVLVKDSTGCEAQSFKDIWVEIPHLTDVKTNKDTLYTNDSINLSVSADRMASSMSKTNLVYTVISDGKETALTTEDNLTAVWKPENAGEYTITATVESTDRMYKTKTVFAKTTKKFTVQEQIDPHPDKYKIAVAVINHIENEGRQSSYKLHYWNNNNMTGDADCVNTGKTVKAGVGSSYWGGAQQTFTVYEAYIPKTATGFKFHIGDRWFGTDGVVSQSKGVYIFHYSGNKSLYTNITY